MSVSPGWTRRRSLISLRLGFLNISQVIALVFILETYTWTTCSDIYIYTCHSEKPLLFDIMFYFWICACWILTAVFLVRWMFRVVLQGVCVSRQHKTTQRRIKKKTNNTLCSLWSFHILYWFTCDMYPYLDMKRSMLSQHYSSSSKMY